MATMGQLWANTGSTLATLMFTYTIFRRWFPHVGDHLEPFFQRLFSRFYPYIQIKFHEYSGEHFKRSESKATSGIQSYLSKDSSLRAKKLKANTTKGSKSLVLSMDNREEITDEFESVTVWWQSKKVRNTRQSFSFYPAADEKRYYTLKFHRRDREVIIERYLDHVMKEGKMIKMKNRERKLYSNTPGQNHRNQTKWSHVTFEHPASFDTLAMEEKKKEEIKNDLVKFSKSKDYYKKIGKAWKRGYLLFGPPGTGKSTMIAAMANFLEYDVYDLELTTVMDNTQLRSLLIETSTKSIIVIEDIDCSLNLTGQRKKKKEEEEDGDEKKMKCEGEKKESKVTLSGLLNFIDGLWSACGGERIIVFTTNFVDKLDPALIRKGRMDKHIEMSYCGFEAFKVLAKNYLDVEESELFDEVKRLLEVEGIKMTPADVGENLLPKSEGEEGETCLKRLVEALKEEKEEAKRRVEEEVKRKIRREGNIFRTLPKTNLLQGWGQRWECRYERAKEELLCFKGMGPEELKQKLEEETALNYISICSKNPLNGILRLHLPPNNTKMNVVLFPSSSSKG
uniref:AAA+ ATPase domain-containing protein n=1 Tax=Brassica oleracea var. oleracea TaxID=109376 RepID=A0A0D3DC43_BRAOL